MANKEKNKPKPSRKPKPRNERPPMRDPIMKRR